MKMNLFARLLLDTRTDFRFSRSGITDSANVALRQSGMDASIDGVGFGSLNCVLPSVLLVKLSQRLALLRP